MAEIQWIKLKVDMFDNEKIKLIEAMPDADSILVIWIKLLTYAGKSNSSGYIMLTENIPMNEEELATIFNRPLNTVRYAIQIFERYGMIERQNETIKIKNWEVHQNIEGMEKIREQNRIRKQRQRKKEAEKLDAPMVAKTGHVMSRDSHATEEDKEEELDKDKDKEKERDKDQKKNKKESPAPARYKNNISKIIEFYENNGFGTISSFQAETIDDLCKDYAGELVLKAFKTADLQNKRNINYVRGILRNWKNRGLDTLEKIEAEDNKRYNNAGSTYEFSSLEEDLGLKTEPTRSLTQEELDEMNREELPF